jgi:hypothetical protein
MNEQKRFVIRNERIRDNAIAYLRTLKIDEARLYEVKVKPHEAKRSEAQSSLFHIWMREVSRQYAEATGAFHEPKVWKIFFKRMFLGEEHISCRGMEWDETRHTSDLKVREFSDFLEIVEHYCGSELGIVLPHPEDMWREAMGES